MHLDTLSTMNNFANVLRQGDLYSAKVTIPPPHYIIILFSHSSTLMTLIIAKCPATLRIFVERARKHCWDKSSGDSER